MKIFVLMMDSDWPYVCVLRQWHHQIVRVLTLSHITRHLLVLPFLFLVVNLYYLSFLPVISFSSYSISNLESVLQHTLEESVSLQKIPPHHLNPIPITTSFLQCIFSLSLYPLALRIPFPQSLSLSPSLILSIIIFLTHCSDLYLFSPFPLFIVNLINETLTRT